MNLESLLKNIITSGIDLSAPDTIRRIKALNIFQLAFIMLAPVVGLFYFYIGAVPLFYTAIIAGLLMISGIFVLRKTKNMALAGNYAIFILWATIFMIAWNTGAITYEGVIKPSWILNAGLILLAIFLNGYLSGTVWTTIVFLQTGIVIYLYRMGYQFPNLIPMEITATYSMGTYLICILAILLFAFLFEKEKSEALSREQEKSHALRESKRYIDDIFDRSPLPTFIIDNSHRVIQWNLACQELTGVPAEEILGKEVWEGFTLDDHGSIADMIIGDIDSITENYKDSIVSMTDSGWFEFDMFFPKLQGGQRVIVTAAPIFDDNGMVRGAIQTIQELSKLRTGEEITENCMGESFPKPVFRIDPQGKINFWNKACEDHFGFTSEQMLGNSPFSFIAKGYRPIFKDTIIKVFKGESFANKEWRYQSNKGKPVYVMARAFPLQTANGKGKDCIIVNTDITDLKLKVKRFRHYAAESKEKLKSLSEEYDLLKKNIASFIRKKDVQE
ncbi:MAG: PAS domain S-box protein [Deltaproteobacteria bacterium]|nr:PAS domain S-box protein [Deltaproteobacteria bacterium]